MPQNEQRRPGAGSGAAVTSLAGEYPQYSDFRIESEASDPIVALIAQLSAAADRGSQLSIGKRMQLKVRRAPCGFRIERSVRS
jgi:hypothetical protein